MFLSRSKFSSFLKRRSVHMLVLAFVTLTLALNLIGVRAQDKETLNVYIDGDTNISDFIDSL